MKRLVHESFGLVAPLAGSQIQLPRIDSPIILDIAPTLRMMVSLRAMSPKSCERSNT